MIAEDAFGSPLHYFPKVGRLGDTIPFFWNGEYHVFYLLWDVAPTCSWEHIVSTDLISWRELPTTLKTDPDDPTGPDGFHMFTGCVTHHAGTFYLHYTGHNPNNPNGTQFICLATSSDLVHWQKHPEHAFSADSKRYLRRDFRDPYVFWHEEEGLWWMLLTTCTADADLAVQGLARSNDLIVWEQAAPLVFDPPMTAGHTVTPECPDLFQIGDAWHLLYTRVTQNIRRAKTINGPYRLIEPTAVDTPRLLAGKRLFDGGRHLYFGPLGGEKGDTVLGIRELYGGPENQLFSRAPAEMIALFDRTVTKLTSQPILKAGEPAWQIQTPEDYLLTVTLSLSTDAEVTLIPRFAENRLDRCQLHLNGERKEMAADHCTRPFVLDRSGQVTIRLLLQGTVVEWLIDDRYTLSARDYAGNHPFAMTLSQGEARILALHVQERTG